MNEILNLSINDMARTEFECSCGKMHNFSVHDIEIGTNKISELTKIAKPFKERKVLVVSDNNTHLAAGEKAETLLKEDGFNINSMCIERGDDILIPDENVVGDIFENVDLDTGLLIAVGSGTINDLVKFVSSRTKIPYLVVCTAPSMDGYVSDGAALINHGQKISYKACLPYAVIGDTEIMKKAPMRLIHAGFGDVVGKITALLDWDLSAIETNEYQCETCVKLVDNALEKCFNKASELKSRDEEAVNVLIEALTLTGVAMGLIGVSRPASGAEHLLSHYWEMDFIAKNKFPELHGIKVGIATPVIAEVFEILSDILPEEINNKLVKREEIEQLLKKAGCPVSPKEIGISKKLFHESMLESYAVRDRYSILKFAKDNDRLVEVADKITKRIYG